MSAHTTDPPSPEDPAAFPQGAQSDSTGGGPPSTPDRSRRSTFLRYSALAFLVATGIVHAAGLATVNDDAFISFRYAEQFLEGHGLVYNPGERVEGYTNFLWTMILAAGMALGLDPVGWSIGLGICFFAGTIVLTALLARRMPSAVSVHPAETRPAAMRPAPAGRRGILLSLPLAAIALVLHRDVVVYATSGLETSMQTFFVTLLLYLLATGTDTRRLLGAGCTLVAAMMTRPDAVVVGGAAALFLCIGGPSRIRRLTLFAAPALAMFLPYWLIRWDYYGAFFPNAFHAKSIALPYYGQGLEYARMYFTAYYPLLLLPLLVVYHYTARLLNRRTVVRTGLHVGQPAARSLTGGTETERSGSAVTEDRVILLGTLIAGLFTLFVIRIGGDFMFARFLVPVTPAAYLALEAMIRSVAGRTRRDFPTDVTDSADTADPVDSPAVGDTAGPAEAAGASGARIGMAGGAAVVLALFVVAGTFFRYDHFTDRNQVGYIADEWQRYPLTSLDETKKTGAILQRAFDGLPVRVAFWGGQARLMYYARPHLAIEAMTGLTDTAIARQPIDGRGRPGHEKEARIEYLMLRGVDFYFRPFAPPPPGAPALNLIVFDSVAARIVSYRNEVMEELRARPGVRFTPMPEFLDDYLRTLDSKYPREVAADYAWFREFYFRHNEDPAREGVFREFLGR